MERLQNIWQRLRARLGEREAVADRGLRPDRWPTLQSPTVTCIACGATVNRAQAREYDKYGDRWTRTDKSFEYLCRSCFAEVSTQPRDDLEARLVRLGQAPTQEAFVRQYLTDARQVAHEDEHS